MLVAGLLKTMPDGKEAITITQDTLMLENQKKRKTEEKMRDPRS